MKFTSDGSVVAIVAENGDIFFLEHSPTDL